MLAESSDKKLIPWRETVVCLLLGLLLSGCGSMATRKGFYDPITAELQQGEYTQAAVGLETAKTEGKFEQKDRVVYYLDAGLAYHYADMYDTSNVRLSEAESAAEDLFTKSISRAAISLLLNDNVLEYAGEDHEVLYGNLISALNYIALNDVEDAFVEIRRANLKLTELDRKYADAADVLNRGQEEDTSGVRMDYEPEHVRFYNSAFARYLSMHMYAADGKFDDARIDYEFIQHAFEEQPYIYSFPMPDVRYTSDNGSVLSVVALAGLAPVKEAYNLRIRTDKDLDLVQVLYTDSDNSEETEYAHFPVKIGEDFYFKFAIPHFTDRVSVIDHVNVYASGQFLGRLQILEDVGLVARETYKAKESLILIRSVARAIAKGLAAHRAKKGADTGGLAGWLKKAAIDVVSDLSENADLRCSRLLPGRVLVGDFVLEPGTYDLSVEFVDGAGGIVGTQSYGQYEVLERGLNLVEAVSLK